MDRLVVKGARIKEYVNLITKYINEFMDIVSYLNSEKEKLVWDSDNYPIMIEKYDNMIKENLAYAERMMKLMHYLDKTLNGYDDALYTIKKEYKKIDEENIREVIK